MKLFIMCAGTFAHTRNPRVSVETQPWVTITRSTTAVYLRENIAVLDYGRQCAVLVQLSRSQSPVMVHAQRIVNILRLMKMVTSSVDTQTSVTSETAILFCVETYAPEKPVNAVEPHYLRLPLLHSIAAPQLMTTVHLNMMSIVPLASSSADLKIAMANVTTRTNTA